MQGNPETWVQDYVRWCEQQIDECIVKAKLFVQLVRVVRGPMTITFQITLMPQSLNRQSMQSLLNLNKVIAVACRTQNVRIAESSDGLINIELPLPSGVCSHISASALQKLTRGPNLCVGIDALRQPAHLDIRHHGAILWVGPSRIGKTQSIKSVLYGILAQESKVPVRFMVLAEKAEDWDDVRELRQCWGIAHTAEDMKKAIGWSLAELRRRTVSKIKRPLIIIIADDMINLINLDASLGSDFGAIASQGAGQGMHLFVGTQEAGSKRGTGDNSVENNVTARFVYRIANSQAASRAAGRGGVGVDQLSGEKGDCLFILHGNSRRVATGYVDDELFGVLPSGVEPAPWTEIVAVEENNRRNQPQPSTTDDNRLQPVVAGGRGVWPASEKVDTRDDSIHAPASTPVATSGTTGAATADELMFPVNGRRPLNERERAAVREMKSGGASLNQIYFRVYGHKDGKVAGWIKEALEEAGDKPVEVGPVDVSGAIQEPEQSQQVLAALLKSGKIDWKATVQMNKEQRLSAS